MTESETEFQVPGFKRTKGWGLLLLERETWN